MKIMMFPTIGFSLLLLGFLSIMAQEAKVFHSTVEKVVTTIKPGWKLVSMDERGKQASYFWGPEMADMADVRISIFSGVSKGEATKEMRDAISHISIGPDEKLTNIGDEAYLWTSPGGRFAAIRFRKSNLYIDISATSLSMAEDLAKSLARGIPKK